MKGPGLFWMLQTAAGLSMAAPMFVVGFEFFRTGRTLSGVGFFALGAVALYFPTYFLNRIGGPRTWIRRRLGRGDSSESDEPTADESDSNGTFFDRFRQ
ncbi:hypothetical protein [Natronorubrum daqingense]|uniref:Uncharacterized protein n=1 Tax=Natronorubrum daqingense TaxID=588898 RepID=A0A1N7G8X3_9EURY|nr:hypothetical protein [Natronorubrum daqingense]APX97281.1 hypothetical protein BB347_12000 [Natronorubrum daqingense]SIS08896.1 hypothetical protein SAMN05421809_3802 [Natronorubrum daqingense]